MNCSKLQSKDQFIYDLAFHTDAFIKLLEDDEIWKTGTSNSSVDWIF